MATVTIEYVTCTQLCCGDLPAEVILCVPAAIVAAHTCPQSDEDTDFEYSYIEGTIQQAYTLSGRCTPSYRYNISYDDAQLVEEMTLNVTDISGVFCKTCLTEWIENLVGNEPYIRDEEGGGQTFISPHGCEYPLSSVSSGITVLDTNSVNLTLAGSQLSADSKISASLCNAVSIEADGLFAKGLQTGTTETAVTNLTTVSGCNFVDVDVRISEEDGNIIDTMSDGLYAVSPYVPLHVDTEASGNIGTTPQSLMGYVVLGGTILDHKVGLLIHGVVYATNSANKTLSVFLGGDEIVGPFSFTTSGYIDIQITLYRAFPINDYIATSVVTQGATVLSTSLFAGNLDFNTNKTLSIWASSDGSNDTIIGRLLTVTRVRAPV